MSSLSPSVLTTSQANVAIKARTHTRSAKSRAQRRKKREQAVQFKKLRLEFTQKPLHTKKDINGRIKRKSNRVRRLFVTGLQLSKQAVLEEGSLNSATREASRNYLERAYRAAEHVLRLVEHRRRLHSKDNSDTDRPTFSREDLVSYCHLLVYNKPY